LLLVLDYRVLLKSIEGNDNGLIAHVAVLRKLNVLMLSSLPYYVANPLLLVDVGRLRKGLSGAGCQIMHRMVIRSRLTCLDQINRGK
jgi:hypothetical protein